MPRKAVNFVMSLTPFDASERLDEDALRLHLRRLSAAGVGVYVAGSGSGEANSMSKAEIDRVLAIGVEELKGKVPVYAQGVEPRTAKQMLQFVDQAESSGVDAVQIYQLDAGHGYKPNDLELEEYFTSILDKTHIPAIIASHRGSGYEIPLDMLVRLLKRFENIVGVNWTTMDNIRSLVLVIDAVSDAVGDRVDVVVGGPYFGLINLTLGGTGFMTSEGNLAPRLCQSVTDNWNKRNMDATTQAYARLMRLWAVNRAYGNVVGIKAALEILGLPGGRPRRPRMPVPSEERTPLKRVIEALGIGETEVGGAAIVA
jgi:4-hydroxy-tetrahydrodipicolinate synthase